MSLAGILDDLKDGVKDISTLSQEDIKVKVTKDKKFSINASLFDKKVLDKFNTLYNQLTLKNTIASMSKVDFKIAHEVFTMLPEVSNTEKAKITSYPSEITKNVLDSVLSKIEDQVPEEAIQMLINFNEDISRNKGCIEEVTNAVNRFSEILTEQDKRLTANKPIIITDGMSKNLYTEPLWSLAYVDDTQLDYPKYANELGQRFRNLHEDETLKTFLDFYKVDTINNDNTVAIVNDIKLCELVQKVISLAPMVSQSVTYLKEYISQLEQFLQTENKKNITDTSYFLVNQLASRIDAVKHLQMLHTIIETPNNFFEKLEDLLKFID